MATIEVAGLRAKVNALEHEIDALHHPYADLGAAGAKMSPLKEILLYTKHWPDCSGAEIACSCGLSQLKRKYETELGQLVSERTKSAHQDGANWMLESITGSLRGYPDHGGDIGVMTEVERIIGERTKALREALERLRETFRHSTYSERVEILKATDAILKDGQP